MRIVEMNWMQVEEYLRHDDRAILPLGSVEQHGYLSLAVDAILAERVAVEAAEPLGVPVFPAQPYGLTPYFRSFPGSITLRMETYVRLVREILDSLAEVGFRRILVVNGHGGNGPVSGLIAEWIADHPGLRVKFHNWYNAPKSWARAASIDPMASHASWFENFPWTRLPGVALPAYQKPMTDPALLRVLSPQEVREYLGDGNYGGYYQRSDEEMLAIWQVAVDETRELLETGWGR